jgi:hypothetical protein
MLVLRLFLFKTHVNAQYKTATQAQTKYLDANYL